MEDKNKDIYKLSLFPMMLQVIYNSENAMSCANYERGKTSVENYNICDNFALRPSIEDCRLILRAFASIGITPRFPKKEIKRHWYNLRHVTNEENNKVHEMFNPDVEERDLEIENLKEQLEEKNKELLSQRKDDGDLKNEIHNLAIRCIKICETIERNINSIIDIYKYQDIKIDLKQHMIFSELKSMLDYIKTKKELCKKSILIQEVCKPNKNNLNPSLI